MTRKKLIKGREAVLLSLPDGYTSESYSLTVGNKYIIKDLDGSNAIITTDDPKRTASIWSGRLEMVKKK
jgi:hypothetical protein